jgi:hypothetical protein
MKTHAGFTGGCLVCELGTVQDMASFFYCARAHMPNAYPQIDFSLITDHLYRRYISRGELTKTMELMQFVKKTFAKIESARVNWDELGLNKANSELDVGQPTLADVFVKFFNGFTDCAESATATYESFKSDSSYSYQPVHITLTDFPLLAEERGRKWSEYDTLEGDPFWLAVLKRQAAKQAEGFQRTKVVAETKFIPEFTSNSGDEFVLISNHNFVPNNGFEMSVAFNRARVAHARRHFPDPNAKCMLVYDLRGQVVSEFSRNLLRSEFAGLCELKLDI